MGDIVHALGITFPILFLAAVGWVGRHYLRFPDNAEFVLTRYVVYMAAPASLLVAITDSKLEDLLNLKLTLATLLIYAIAFLGVLVLQMVVGRRSLGVSAFAGFVVAKFNLVIIGLPLLMAAVGSQGVPAFVINGFVSYMVLTPLVLFLNGVSGGQSSPDVSTVRVVLTSLKETFTNPLIIGSFLGLILLVAGVKLPTVLGEPLKMIGSSVVPAGLVAVGLSIRQIKPTDWGLEIWLMALAKLIIVPAMAVAVALAFGLDPVSAVSTVLLFCIPSAVVAYALAVEVDAYAQEAGKIVVVTTIFGAISIPITVFVCQVIWGI